MLFLMLAIEFLFLTLIIYLLIDLIFGNKSDKKSNKHSHTPWIFEPAEKRYGNEGEKIATAIIKTVLREDDALFTNIKIVFDNKEVEMDDVIVNKYGIFIIEVKTQKGRLYGSETDYEWEKYKDDGYGNTFESKEKNSIRQVNRQAGILSSYIEYYTGKKIWVEGYAYFVNQNSPVESKSVLKSTADIDKAIHTFGRNRLNKSEVEKIKKILEESY